MSGRVDHNKLDEVARLIAEAAKLVDDEGAKVPAHCHGGPWAAEVEALAFGVLARTVEAAMRMRLAAAEVLIANTAHRLTEAAAGEQFHRITREMEKLDDGGR